MSTVKKDPRNGDALGTGRRKTAIVRVRIRAGAGNITVNERTLEDYFVTEAERRAVREPLEAAGVGGAVDVAIRATGGGTSAQSQACIMGIARALISYSPEHFAAMSEKKYLTRDSRMKERKKFGLRGARRGTQFSKR